VLKDYQRKRKAKCLICQAYDKKFTWFGRNFLFLAAISGFFKKDLKKTQ